MKGINPLTIVACLVIFAFVWQIGSDSQQGDATDYRQHQQKLDCIQYATDPDVC